jgi:hypothetical protein
MNRDYDNGVKDDVVFFTGIEIEKTPAYGKKTLFVVGIQDANKITELAQKNECDHIYLGANHSFKNQNLDQWEGMALKLLENEFWTTLDFDIRYYDAILDTICCLSEYQKFIAQISAKLPNLSHLNYNTCIKIDDKDFKASNPGVWIHQLHDLMDRTVFTDWSQYGKDKPINE